MPKMTHWNVAEPVDVPAAKVAVYAAQGWVSVGARPAKVQPAVTAVTTDSVDVAEPAPVDVPAAKPAKKAAPKKAVAKRAAKKS